MKPSLDYTKKIFVDVNIDNSGRCTFDINKGLHGTKAFTAVGVFNPEIFTKMDLDTEKSHLYQLEMFECFTKEIIDNAFLEAGCVLNHTRSHSELPDVNIKHHAIIQKGNVEKKKIALQHILKRRRNESFVEIELLDEHPDG